MELHIETSKLDKRSGSSVYACYLTSLTSLHHSHFSFLSFSIIFTLSLSLSVILSLFRFFLFTTSLWWIFQKTSPNDSTIFIPASPLLYSSYSPKSKVASHYRFSPFFFYSTVLCKCLFPLAFPFTLSSISYMHF